MLQIDPKAPRLESLLVELWVSKLRDGREVNPAFLTADAAREPGFVKNVLARVLDASPALTDALRTEIEKNFRHLRDDPAVTERFRRSAEAVRAKTEGSEDGEGMLALRQNPGFNIAPTRRGKSEKAGCGRCCGWPSRER